jgi:hypothetical protein
MMPGVARRRKVARDLVRKGGLDENAEALQTLRRL